MNDDDNCKEINCEQDKLKNNNFCDLHKKTCNNC